MLQLAQQKKIYLKIISYGAETLQEDWTEMIIPNFADASRELSNKQDNTDCVAVQKVLVSMARIILWLRKRVGRLQSEYECLLTAADMGIDERKFIEQLVDNVISGPVRSLPVSFVVKDLMESIEDLCNDSRTEEIVECEQSTVTLVQTSDQKDSNAVIPGNPEELDQTGKEVDEDLRAELERQKQLKEELSTAFENQTEEISLFIHQIQKIFPQISHLSDIYQIIMDYRKVQEREGEAKKTIIDLKSIIKRSIVQVSSSISEHTAGILNGIGEKLLVIEGNFYFLQQKLNEASLQNDELCQINKRITEERDYLQEELRWQVSSQEEKLKLYQEETEVQHKEEFRAREQICTDLQSKLEQSIKYRTWRVNRFKERLGRKNVKIENYRVELESAKLELSKLRRKLKRSQCLFGRNLKRKEIEDLSREALIKEQQEEIEILLAEVTSYANRVKEIESYLLEKDNLINEQEQKSKVEKAELEDKLAALTDQFAALRQEEDRLQRLLEELKGKLNEKEILIEQYCQKIEKDEILSEYLSKQKKEEQEKLQCDLQRLKEFHESEVARMSNEIDLVKTELKEECLRKNRDQQEHILEMESNVRIFENEKAELEIQMREEINLLLDRLLTFEAAEIEWNRINNDLKEKISFLEADLDSMKASANEEYANLKSEICLLNSEKGRLETEVEQSNNEIALLKDSLSEKQSTLLLLQTESEGMRAEIAEQTNEFHEKIARVQSDMDQMSVAYEELIKSKEDCEERLYSLMQQKSDLTESQSTTTMEEIITLKTTIDRLEQTRWEMEGDIYLLKGTEKELNDDIVFLEQRMELMQETLRRKDEEINSLRQLKNDQVDVSVETLTENEVHFSVQNKEVETDCSIDSSLDASSIFNLKKMAKVGCLVHDFEKRVASIKAKQDDICQLLCKHVNK